MASTLPPVRAATYNFPVSLVSVGDTDIFQTDVTITTADVWVSKDGGAFAAAAAAPIELLTGASAKTGVLWQNLTAAEMTADLVTVLYHDASGDEWQDAMVTIYTAAQTHDATDIIADDIKATVNHADYGNAKLVRSTTPANTLDVSAGGEAGVDWANVGSPTTTVGLSGTTVKAVTDGVALANDAITSAKFDESTAFPLKAADSGSTYVARTGADSDTLETLSDEIAAISAGGATAAEVWAYASRTLTQSAATVTSVVSGSTITATRGDTLTASVTGLGNISTRSKLWFTVKDDNEDLDSAAMIQIEETGGLLYMNGAAAGTASNGSITVTNETTGALTIVLKAAETDDLRQCTAHYDIQMLTSAGVVTTLTQGVFDVGLDTTRAVS